MMTTCDRNRITEGAVVVERRAGDSGLFLATDLPSPEDKSYLLAFAAQGSRLAVACDYGAHIYVFDARSGRLTASRGGYDPRPPG